MTLERSQLERLMQLAFEAAALAQAFGEPVVARYHWLAARCGLELWRRNQRCGRGVALAESLPGETSH
jgi:hypothetical protein